MVQHDHGAIVLPSATQLDIVQFAQGAQGRHTQHGFFGRGAVWLIALHRIWRRRVTERGYLLTSDHRLRLDMEASGQDIAQEVAKPLWRA